MYFFLGLMLGWGGPIEAGALVEPADYFRFRGIADDADSLARLAAKDADGPKAELVRTLAIFELGRRKDSRATLEAVAAGPEGPARDAAEAALAEWDGKPLPRGKPPEESVRRLAAAWFPADCAFYVVVDALRLPSAAAAPPEVRNAFRAEFKGPAASREMFEVLEATGPIRADRVSLAVAHTERSEDGRLVAAGRHDFIHYSGRANRRSVCEFLRRWAQPGSGEDGDEVTRFRLRGGFALVGDTDFVRGDLRLRPDIDAELMDIRAGKRIGLAKGIFARDLKALSADAAAACVGNTPPEFRRSLGAVGFTVFPPVTSAELVPVAEPGSAAEGGKAPILRLRVRFPMDGEPDAAKLLEEAETARKKAVEALKEPAAPLDAESAAVLSELLRSAKLSRDGSDALGEVTLSAEAVAGLWRLAGKTVLRPRGNGN